MTMKVRVLCVDDSEDIAELLHRLMRRDGTLEGAGVATSADGLAERVAESRADVVVLDLSMPGADPLEELRAMTERGSACRAIVMSGYDDRGTIDRAIEAGASGFVSKNGEPGEILVAIREVAKGGVYLPRR